MNVAIEQADNINMDSWSLPGLDMQRESWSVPPRQEWQVDGKIRQIHSRKKTATLFKQFNGHYLSINAYRRKKALPEQVIDLTFVEANPREVRDNCYRLWFVAVCLLTIPATVYSLVPFSPLWLGLPVVLALVLMTAAALLRRHHFDFLALNSDVVLFRIDALSSEQPRVGAFIKNIRAGIALGQRQLPDGRQRVPLAVAEMRRLSEEGVISRRQYEAIKQRWFGVQDVRAG